MGLAHRLGHLVAILGFVVLSVMVVTLLSSTIVEAWRTYLSSRELREPAPDPVGGDRLDYQLAFSLLMVFLLVLIALGTLVEIVREGRQVLHLLPSEAACKRTCLNAIGVLGGALLTYILSWDVGLGAVTASALVGLLAALVLPVYAVPIYCGSFVGMTSSQLLAGCGELALAGAVAALVYVLTPRSYMGYGGKLGTIAFSGTVLTCLGLRRVFLPAGLPSPQVKAQIVAYAVIATVVTYVLNVSLGHGPVIASSVIGLVGGLVLPALYPQHGPLLAVVVICASFAGMSSEAKFPTLWMMGIVGVVSGVIFVYSLPRLGGAGGKLGTIAFTSVLAVRGWWDLIARALSEDAVAEASIPTFLRERP